MTESKARPPSKTENNADLVVWSLYQLGATDKWFDVEDLYLKMFELAPARLSWRKHTQYPDYKKCAKALQEVEDVKRSDHLGLVTKGVVQPQAKRPRSNERRLTLEGLQWCEEHQEQLAALYSSTVVPNARAQPDARLIRNTTRSDAYTLWKETGALPDALGELAEAFMCGPKSPAETWEMRFDERTLAARRNGHTELLEFLNAARHHYRQETDTQ